MREIKFRAWDKEYNEMMDADYFGIDEYITPEGEVVEKETHSGIGFSDMYMVDISDKRILMQYTGLKDKNGREIYEGDILSIEGERYPFATSWNVIVKFIDGSYVVENSEGTDGYYLFDESVDIEVIGNIYENPELLEGDTP